MAFNRSKILSITETTWLSERKKLRFVEGDKWCNDDDDMEGYVIELDMGSYRDNSYVKFGIYQHSNCCENWGYLTSEDDLEQFVGADLINVYMVDTALKVYPVMKEAFNSNEESSEDCVQFVNINTSVGMLQLVAYNAHNGYYGHAVVLESENLSHRETI